MALLKVVAVVVLAMLCMHQASCELTQVAQEDQKVANDAKPEPKPFFGLISGALNAVGNVAGAVVNGVANLATGIVNGAAVVLGTGVCAATGIVSSIFGGGHTCGGGAQLSCTWRQGTLANGNVHSIGIIKGNDCAVKCYQLSKQHGNQAINGATVQHSDGQCFCQINANTLNPYQGATSCIFTTQGGHGDAKVAKEPEEKKDTAEEKDTHEFDYRAEEKKDTHEFDYTQEEFDIEKKK